LWIQRVMEQKVTATSTWQVNLVLAAVLIAGCLVAYLPAMRAGFIWDDDAYVTENPLLRVENGLQRIWFSLDQPSQYFPMTYTVFLFEYKMWKLNPFGYHLVNILIHIANALLLWLVLSKLRIGGAWLAAAIFALHPVNVESVAWITELKNTMMGLFSLLSVLAWWRFINQSRTKSKERLVYALSLVLFALALFSKTTACTVPVAMLLILWFKRIRIRGRNLRLMIPYVLLAIVTGIVTILWEQVRGIGGEALELNYLERVLVAARALCFYIGKLILPIDLMFNYPLWNIDWTKAVDYSWALVVFLAAAALWFFRSKIGRGPCTTAAYFAVTLAPVLGFVSIYTHYYSYVADHYVYMACIGPIALFAAIASSIRDKMHSTGRSVLSVCMAAVLIIFGVLTWRQTHIYKDLETLWQDTLKKNPDSLLAEVNMGVLLQQRGDTEGALKRFYRALEILPDDEQAYYNIGNIYKSQGKLDEAVDCYKKALEILPDFIAARNNLANTLKMQGKMDEAVEQYKKVLQINPRDAQARYNLANTYLSLGRFDEAIDSYKRAIELAPQFTAAMTNLAIALESSGRVDEAVGEYHKVLVLDPNELIALNSLAELIIRNPAADANGAVGYAERAAEITNYKNPAVLNLLVRSYIAAGDKEKAVAAAQKALDLAVAGGDKKLEIVIRQWIEKQKKTR
jgi:tetratricopeptide (TPR) repeat protein